MIILGPIYSDTNQVRRPVLSRVHHIAGAQEYRSIVWVVVLCCVCVIKKKLLPDIGRIVVRKDSVFDALFFFCQQAGCVMCLML